MTQQKPKVLRGLRGFAPPELCHALQSFARLKAQETCRGPQASERMVFIRFIGVSIPTWHQHALFQVGERIWFSQLFWYVLVFIPCLGLHALDLATFLWSNHMIDMSHVYMLVKCKYQVCRLPFSRRMMLKWSLFDEPVLQLTTRQMYKMQPTCSSTT